MFKKKHCPRCESKVSEKDNFCPSCGLNLSKPINKDNWGMLGKNDLDSEFEGISNSPFSGFGGGMLNKMISHTMKMIEKEMQKSAKVSRQELNNSGINSHFELYVNGKRINPENIKITKKTAEPIKNKNPKISQNIFFSEEKAKKFSKLTKEEPKTSMRRVSNKIMYELEVPGVKNIDEISIIRLENSIEIKAVSKSENKAYFKVIPVNLPLSGYSLSQEKIILELNTE